MQLGRVSVFLLFLVSSYPLILPSSCFALVSMSLWCLVFSFTSSAVLWLLFRPVCHYLPGANSLITFMGINSPVFFRVFVRLSLSSFVGIASLWHLALKVFVLSFCNDYKCISYFSPCVLSKLFHARHVTEEHHWKIHFDYKGFLGGKRYCLKTMKSVFSLSFLSETLYDTIIHPPRLGVLRLL